MLYLLGIKENPRGDLNWGSQGNDGAGPPLQPEPECPTGIPSGNLGCKKGRVSPMCRDVVMSSSLLFGGIEESSLSEYSPPPQTSMLSTSSSKPMTFHRVDH